MGFVVEASFRVRQACTGAAGRYFSFCNLIVVW